MAFPRHTRGFLGLSLRTKGREEASQTEERVSGGGRADSLLHETAIVLTIEMFFVIVASSVLSLPPRLTRLMPIVCC